MTRRKAPIPTIHYHLKKVFEDSELEEGAVLRSSRMTAADGKGYDTKHYNLSAIIAARPGLVARIENAASLRLRAVELGFYRARFAV